MSKMIGPDYDAAKSKAFYEGFNEIQPFNLEDRINAAIEKAYMRGFYDGVEFVEKRHGMEVRRKRQPMTLWSRFWRV